MIITTYLLVSVYILNPKVSVSPTQTQSKPIPQLTYKHYPTQEECHTARNTLQKQIKVGISHTFCTKVRYIAPLT
jgi:hypothetical protein